METITVNVNTLSKTTTFYFKDGKLVIPSCSKLGNISFKLKEDKLTITASSHQQLMFVLLKLKLLYQPVTQVNTPFLRFKENSTTLILVTKGELVDEYLTLQGVLFLTGKDKMKLKETL